MIVKSKKNGKIRLPIALFLACLFFFALIANSQSQSLDLGKSSSVQQHPLPTSLASWTDTTDRGDYFDLIESTPVGYLIWWQLPIKVYVEPVSLDPHPSAQQIRFQQWFKSVETAIEEWNDYLPLEIVDSPEKADLKVLRASVSREIKLDPETGLYDIPRAITAQTTYEFYLTEAKVLAHKMTVTISPELGEKATLAAARHELGHSLGIWGHSDLETDALYFSQVRDTPQISVRDVNTLKKIYQQPTKLGWQQSISN